MKWLDRAAAFGCALFFKRGKNFKESYNYWLSIADDVGEKS